MDRKEEISKYFDNEMKVLFDRACFYTDYGCAPELEPIAKILLESLEKLNKAKEEFLTNY